MPIHNFECRKEVYHFEADEPWDSEVSQCPKCGSIADRVWMSPRSPHQQLQTPIVMWRYSNGKLGVAGGANSQTPKNAERIEIRSVGEYRRHVKELNAQMRSKEERREEQYRAVKEKQDHETRSRLSYLMGQESDPTAREIYRQALDYNKGGHEKLPFSEFFSMAMEMDPGNYERD